MSNDTLLLELRPSILNAATRLAAEDGVSLHAWIALAVAQKIGSIQTAAEFFRHRAGDAQAEDLLRVLALAPTAHPIPATSCRPVCEAP